MCNSDASWIVQVLCRPLATFDGKFLQRRRTSTQVFGRIHLHCRQSEFELKAAFLWPIMIIRKIAQSIFVLPNATGAEIEAVQIAVCGQLLGHSGQNPIGHWYYGQNQHGLLFVQSMGRVHVHVSHFERFQRDFVQNHFVSKVKLTHRFQSSSAIFSTRPTTEWSTKSAASMLALRWSISFKRQSEPPRTPSAMMPASSTRPNDAPNCTLLRAPSRKDETVKIPSPSTSWRTWAFCLTNNESPPESWI